MNVNFIYKKVCRSKGFLYKTHKEPDFENFDRSTLWDVNK